ncbi:MAG: carboxypeptidase regulatory-like domain-containing protein [Gammaproteobacteria bacterium]|nr:carboxypeptidase regulatory-like domain-containing protein [Gammaproteobacteria bacterium]
MINIRHTTIGVLAIPVTANYLPEIVRQSPTMDSHSPALVKTPSVDATDFRRNEVDATEDGRNQQAILVPDSLVTDKSGDPVKTVSIRGWLGNEFGQGLAGFRVHIRPTLRLAGISDVYSVTSGPGGEFQFDAIPIDMTYRLDVEASQYYAGYTLDPFPVSPGKPVTRIILDSLKLVDVDGMIVDADDAPVSNFEFFVQNLTVDFPGRWIRSDASGYFRLDSFPAGKLQLYTTPPDIFKIEELMLRDNEYRNLMLAIDRGNYHLYGWVSDENGAPLGQASITLNSEFGYEEYLSFSYRSAETDISGGGSFSRLGGQDHRLAVNAAGFQPVVLDHRFQSFTDTLRIQLRRQ